MNVEIDLSGLKQDKEGNVLWSKNIGELIPFVYNNEIDYLKIIGYCKYHVTLELNGRTRKIHITNIYNNHIEPLLGVYTQKFQYEPGDVLGNFRVVEQIFITKQTESTENKLLKGQQERKYRGYKIECINCKKVYEIKQKNILNEKINIECECKKKTSQTKLTKGDN